MYGLKQWQIISINISFPIIQENPGVIEELCPVNIKWGKVI